MKTKTIKKKIEKKLNSPKDNLVLEKTVGHRDHFTYNIYYKEKIVVAPFQISRTSKEYGKRLMGLMARQLGISSGQLKGIEKCTFWAKDFIENSRFADKTF